MSPSLADDANQLRILATMDSERRSSVIKIPDTTLMWKLKPHAQLFPHEKLNSKGYRGDEGESPKPLSVYRILALGDSRTFGFGITQERETFCGLLNQAFTEQRLNKRIEALNLSVIGYSSYQGRKLLEKIVPEYDPDLIIIWFGFNDSLFFHLTDRNAASQPTWFHSAFASMDKLFFVQFLRKSLKKIHSYSSPIIQLNQAIVRRVPPEDYRENLAAMIQYSKSRGIRTLILTTPVRAKIPLILNAKLIEHRGDNGKIFQRLQNQYDLEGFWLMDAESFPGSEDALDSLITKYPELPILHYYKSKFLESAGKSEEAAIERELSEKLDTEREAIAVYNGITSEVCLSTQSIKIDLVPSFDTYKDTRLFVDDCHPNQLGHTLIAQLLYDWMASDPQITRYTSK